jgi:hypothetical protein
MLVTLALKVFMQVDREFVAVSQLYFVSKFKWVILVSAFLPNVFLVGNHACLVPLGSRSGP